MIIDIAIQIQLYQAKLAEAIKTVNERQIKEFKKLLFDEIKDMEIMLNKIKRDIN